MTELSFNLCLHSISISQNAVKYNNNPFLVELIGDIYYKKNNQKLAREFYQKSLQFNLSPNKTKIINNKIDLLQK